MGDGEQMFFGRFTGVMFYMDGLMIRSWYGQGSFANAFPSSLKTLNLKAFANHEGIYT